MHRTYIGMSTTEFSRLGRCEEAWPCPSCASINNSSRIYSVPNADDHEASQSLNYLAHPSMLDSVPDISFPTRSTDQPYEPSFNSSSDPVFSSPKPALRPKPQRKSTSLTSHHSTAAAIQSFRRPNQHFDRSLSGNHLEYWTKVSRV